MVRRVLYMNKLLKTGYLFAVTTMLCGLPLHAGIIVAPNPWVPDDVNTTRGNYGDGIRFANVPADGEIRIYTTVGNLVRTIEYHATTTVTWDGKNADGEYLASGIYLWVVKSSDFTKTGKLIILR